MTTALTCWRLRVARELAPLLGTTVVVENRVGVSRLIGAEAIGKGPRDGPGAPLPDGEQDHGGCYSAAGELRRERRQRKS